MTQYPSICIAIWLQRSNSLSQAVTDMLWAAAKYNISSCGIVHEKVRGGQEVAMFRQTPANFRQRRSCVLKISILPPNSHRMGVLYFWKKIFIQEENSETGWNLGRLGPAPSHCSRHKAPNIRVTYNVITTIYSTSQTVKYLKSKLQLEQRATSSATRSSNAATTHD